MICILTEDKDWVPDAVSLLESQGETVNVTYCNHPASDVEAYDAMNAFTKECSSDMCTWFHVHYPPAVVFDGLTAIAGDFYSNEEFETIKNKVVGFTGGAE